MKLTQLQRYTAYCIMLKEAEYGSYKTYLGYRKKYEGFCNMATVILKNHIDPILKDGEMQQTFPELWEKKPIKLYSPEGLWFKDHDWKLRIPLLKQCIEETHPDNPKNKPRHAK